jgi:iron complex transport system ATP-binding protein
MALIEVDQLTYRYPHGRKAILENISLGFHRGKVISLLGPNGSGKTTLLKLILGLLRPQHGTVQLEGRNLTQITPKQLARKIAYVPQLHRVSFGYRVLDVVLMGRMPHKSMFFNYSEKDEKIALEALQRLSIDHLKDRSYTEISGGERQLVLIARALTQGAEIFVMDEPVNGLDYGNQIRLLTRIIELVKSGYTFIKTTHFPDHALWVSDRVVMLKQGKIIADGLISETITRENLYNLYQIDVDVFGIQGGRICVPEALSRFHADSDCANKNNHFNLIRAVG